MRCGIIEVRNSEDAVGSLCLKPASEQCSDCGTGLCEAHICGKNKEATTRSADCLTLIINCSSESSGSPEKVGNSWGLPFSQMTGLTWRRLPEQLYLRFF